MKFVLDEACSTSRLIVPRKSSESLPVTDRIQSFERFSVQAFHQHIHYFMIKDIQQRPIMVKALFPGRSVCRCWIRFMRRRCEQSWRGWRTCQISHYNGSNPPFLRKFRLSLFVQALLAITVHLRTGGNTTIRSLLRNHWLTWCTSNRISWQLQMLDTRLRKGQNMRWPDARGSVYTMQP